MGKPIFVFRIQDKKGRGPFAPGLTAKWKSNFDIPPAFFEEWPELLVGFNKKGMNAGCACRTKEQLKRWVNDEEYLKLKELGFEAVIISVDEVVRESENQLIFLRKKALRKGTTRILNYADYTVTV